MTRDPARRPRRDASRPTDLRRRSAGARQEHPRYLVLGEGPTEKNYFDGFKRRGLNLIVKDGGDDHRAVARRAVEATREDYDAVWCVLDTELDSALVADLQEIVAGHDVRLALSAPCFEVWLLLHKRKWTRPLHSADAAGRELRQLMPQWRKGAGTRHADFVKHIDTAITEAKRLDPTGRDHGKNPSTNVWQLVELIR
ncbi:RloB-like protein [Actinocorallia herbida]|uniref:RloB-like protein n=1 Tax=Actinocorallia herbida TaxID=58109 RepID=A0A3N1D7Z3_9ACTN|nr:RloB family protein [Actinocorallia herbida]ROO89640.1 RloB-like protein [Actinocorallia herbida]